MKTLLLLRHGKAQGDAPGGDKERALTERGRTESADTGREIARLVGKLDLLVTSDARRAEQTALIAASAAGYTGEIELEKDLYYTDVDDALRVVRRLPAGANTVLLVGHNPSFEDLVAALVTEGTGPAHLSTAGLAQLEFDAADWKDVRPGTGRLRGVYSPKKSDRSEG